MWSLARAMTGGGRWLLALVLALELAAFVPALVQDGVMRAPETKASDGTSPLYTWRIFWRDEIQAGRAPLWNPFVFAGTPAFAEPQVQTFYPANVIWLVAPPELAQKLTLLLHVMLASGLMFGLARAAGASPLGAAVASLAFGLQAQVSAFVMAGWIQMLGPMAWAPGVLWALVRAMRGPHRARAAGIGGILLGLQILSGHPEWVRYTLFAGGLLVLLERHGTRIGARLRVSLAMLVIGVLVGGPQLVPTIEATSRSSRGDQALMGGTDLHGAGYPFLTLPTLIAPRVFGPWDLHVSTDGLIHKALQAKVSATESLLYVGLLPLALAVVAVVRREQGWAPWAAIAGAGLLFALNDVTHLQCLLDRLIPPDAVFRSPARFVFMTAMALAVLASLGVSAIERSGVPRGLGRVTGLVAGLLVLAGGALMLARASIVDAVLARVQIPQALLDRAAPGMDAATFGAWAIGEAAGQLVMAAAIAVISMAALRRAATRRTAGAAALLVAVLAADLIVTARPFLTSVVDADRLFATDIASLAPLQAIPGARFESSPDVLQNGPSVAMLARVRSLSGYDTFHLREHDRIEQRAAAREPAVLAALGVTHLVHRRGGQVELDAVPGALGRAWWTPAPAADLVEAAAAAAGDVSLETDEPHRLVLRLHAPSDGTLIVTEAFFPGWRARVNEVDTPVAPAFDMFQSVQVPAGESRVELTFEPRSLKVGLLLLAAGLLAAVALLLWPSRARVATPGAEMA